MKNIINRDLLLLKLIMPFLAAICSIFIWSILPILSKLVITNMSISLFLVLRFLISSLILSWIIPKALSKLHIIKPHILLYFFGIIGCNFYLQTWALSKLPPNWYIVIFALNPIFTLILMRETITKLTWTGLIVAITGTCLFATAQYSDAYGIKFISILALFGGMITWSAYIVISKKLHEIFTDLELTALTTFIAFLTSLFILLINKSPITGHNIQHLYLISAIGLAVPLAYFLFSCGIRNIPVITINAQYLEPIISLYFASLILHEPINNMQYLAGIIILSGTILASNCFRKLNNI